MNDDHRQAIALWRYRLISPLLDEDLSPRQRGALRREIAKKHFEHPTRGEVAVAAETLRYWCRIYKVHGFEVLYPQTRSDHGCLRAFDTKILARAERLKREVPERSIPKLIELLVSQGEVQKDQVKRATLHRHLARKGLTARQTKAATIHRRFEALRPGDCWQTDEAHFRFPNPTGPDTREHLFFFIDDHSRLVPFAGFYEHGKLTSLNHSLKIAIRKHGAPRAIYADNGKVFIAKSLALACAQLGIKLLHAAPYEPQSKD